MKSCSKCQTVKPLEDYYKDKSRRDGLTVWCRDCCANSYQSRKDQVKIYGKQKYLKNRTKLLAYYKAKYKPRVNGTPGTIRYEAKLAGFRSGFEQTLDIQLKVAGVSYEYENTKIPYTLQGKYIPDFYLVKQGFYIEAKGLLDRESKAKMLAVKRQNPEIEIRMVFMDADKKIPRTKQTHGQWAERNGFKYANGKIPQEWLDE